MLLLIYLIVRLRLKVGIRCRMLGIDGLTEVFDAIWTDKLSTLLSPLSTIFNPRLYIDQFAHFLADGLVEVEEKLPFLLKERTDVILIIVEERRLPLGTLQGVPMQMPPVAVIADADVLD